MVGGNVDFYLHGERVFYSNEIRVSGAWVISIHIFMKSKKRLERVLTEPRVQDLGESGSKLPFLHVCLTSSCALQGVNG